MTPICNYKRARVYRFNPTRLIGRITGQVPGLYSISSVTGQLSRKGYVSTRQVHRKNVVWVLKIQAAKPSCQGFSVSEGE